MDDKKKELNRILGTLDSDNILENLNRVSVALGRTEQNKQVESLFKELLQEERDDPAVNLLRALAPFLPKTRESKVEDHIKLLNTLNLFKTLGNK